MTDQISPLGWFLIILVVLLIASLYFSLFSKLKHKSEKPEWINSIQQAGKTLKDPFQNENSRMEELASKVDQLQQSRNKSKNENNGNQAGDKSE